MTSVLLDFVARATGRMPSGLRPRHSARYEGADMAGSGFREARSERVVRAAPTAEPPHDASPAPPSALGSARSPSEPAGAWPPPSALGLARSPSEPAGAWPPPSTPGLARSPSEPAADTDLGAGTPAPMNAGSGPASSAEGAAMPGAPNAQMEAPARPAWSEDEAGRRERLSPKVGEQNAPPPPPLAERTEHVIERVPPPEPLAPPIGEAEPADRGRLALDAGEPAVSRAGRSEAAAMQQPPEIVIQIGRIDLRTPPAAAPPQTARPQRPRAKGTDLGDYLRGKGGKR